MMSFQGDRLFGFEFFDLESDPDEAHNLLHSDDGGREMLTAIGHELSVTVPVSAEDNQAEVALAAILEDAELH
jgi:hypothetical protein